MQRLLIGIIVLASVTPAPLLYAQYGVTEKVFVSAGRIELQLGAGSYTIRPASDTHIRVTIGSDSGRARVALTANATRATVAVTETPSSNFQATIEVPKTSDLIVRLSGGRVVSDVPAFASLAPVVAPVVGPRLVA